MALDTTKHRNILIKILKDIYTDNTLGPLLGFKGGTAAYFFYGLSRFSVDLDFDLLDPKREDYVFEKISKIVSNYGQIKEEYKKHYTLLFVLSYGEKEHNVKIEVRRLSLDSSYEVKNYLGIPMKIMSRADMFANKLVAMSERPNKANRDIYDVWFFLNNDWPINRELVQERTGITFKDFIKKCIKQLEGKSDKSILSGMGELLDEKQKAFVKTKLKAETIFLLRNYLETIK